VSIFNSTAGGDTFDRNFLRDTIYSYLIGLAISLSLCVMFFPDTSHSHLKEGISNFLLDTSKLLQTFHDTFIPPSSSSSTYSPPSSPRLKTSHDSHRSLSKIQNMRATLISRLRATEESLKTHLFFTSREPYISLHSLKAYTSISERLSRAFGVLSSLDTAMHGQEDILGSKEFRQVVKAAEAELKEVVEGFLRILRRSAEALKNQSRRSRDKAKISKGVPDEAEDDSGLSYEDATRRDLKRVRKALEVLKGKQTVLAARITLNPAKKEDRLGFDSKNQLLRGTLPQEELLQINFFLLTMMEFVNELEHIAIPLCKDKHKNGKGGMRMWLNLSAFLPRFKFPLFSISRRGGRGGRRNVSIGAKMVKLLMNLYHFVMSRDSVYAFKGAVAVLIYQLVMFNQP
jgi:hypothetical protein